MPTYERRSRRPGQVSAASKSQATDCTQHSGVAGWRRRQAAARRLPSLDCGCGPDPWMCDCTDPPLSEKLIDAGRDAALHILDTRRVPLLELEVLRALYRRGGADRELAEKLHALAGGVAA